MGGFLKESNKTVVLSKDQYIVKNNGRAFSWMI